EIPFKEGDHLAVLVNQGPNGDYDGGKVKGKFTSEDNGKTWDFAEEVKLNEAE
ncbi:oxidoreductase, partial [Bacillus sp. CRN 9]|nr:oxidoreductase [Bacillus sp. CRN 9]